MNHPFVTVVIPTYNHAHFIGETLKALVNQTWKHWEAIVVNNFSTDNTEEVVAAINDSRIRLVNFRNNGIIAASRNEGIRQAKGEWVAFLDSDDIWHREKLEKSLVDHEKFDVVCNATCYFDEHGNTRKARQLHPTQQFYDFLFYQENFLTTSTVVCRTAILKELKGFRELPEIVTAEDYDLWLRLAKANCRFKIIDEPLTNYRIQQASSSANAYRHLGAVQAVLQLHKREREQTEKIDPAKWQRRQARVFYGCGRNLQRLNASKLEIFKMFAAAIKTDASFLQPYAASLLLALPSPMSGRAEKFITQHLEKQTQ